MLKARGELKPATDEDIVADLRRSVPTADARFASFTAAYKETQPHKVWAEEEEEGEGGDGG